ncbi:MAG TPA: hypothetical protein VHF50_05050, partial [Solirubrobacterales bacterium]|nr:hypothetical protein [Solirubrobacterales bacterium]
DLPLRAARTVAIGVRRDQRLRLTVETPERVEGPIPRGDVLGAAIVTLDGAPVTIVPLRAARSVPEASAVDKARDVAGDNAGWLLLAVFAILVAVLFLWRRRR